MRSYWGSDLGSSQGGANGLHWVLDPIDGTRGFVANRQYAVCLGLLHDGEVGKSESCLSLLAWSCLGIAWSLGMSEFTAKEN